MPSYYQGTHTGQQVDAGLDIILAADRGIDALPEATAPDHVLGVESGAAKKVAVAEMKKEAIGAYITKTANGNEISVDDAADGIPVKALSVNVLASPGAQLAVTVEADTIHLNQLVRDGDFPSNASWARTPDVTLNVQNNVATVTMGTISTSSQNNRIYTTSAISWIASHRYYCAFRAKASRAGAIIRAGRVASGTETLVTCDAEDTWYIAARIFPGGATADSALWIYQANSSTLAQTGDTFSVTDVVLIDLTAIFGAGNEPTTVAGVKELLPEDYYAYTLNTPMSRAYGQTAYGEYIGQTYSVDIPAGAEDPDLTWDVINGTISENGGSAIVHRVDKYSPVTYLGNTRIYTADTEDVTYGGWSADYRLDPTLAYNAITNAIVALGGNV